MPSRSPLLKSFTFIFQSWGPGSNQGRQRSGVDWTEGEEETRQEKQNKTKAGTLKEERQENNAKYFCEILSKTTYSFFFFFIKQVFKKSSVFFFLTTNQIKTKTLYWCTVKHSLIQGHFELVVLVFSVCLYNRWQPLSRPPPPPIIIIMIIIILCLFAESCVHFCVITSESAIHAGPVLKPPVTTCRRCCCCCCCYMWVPDMRERNETK